MATLVRALQFGCIGDNSVFVYQRGAILALGVGVGCRRPLCSGSGGQRDLQSIHLGSHRAAAVPTLHCSLRGRLRPDLRRSPRSSAAVLFGGVLLYTALVTGVQTVLALLFFALACYGIGLALLRMLRLDALEHHRRLSLDVLALVAGAGIWGFVGSLLAFTEWNWAAVHGLILAIPAMAGGRSIWIRGRGALRSTRFGDQTLADYWAMTLLL